MMAANRQKRRSMLYMITVFVSLVMIAPLQAKPKVTYEIKEVAKHERLVTFSWHVTIQSDKTWDGCDLKISFRDSNGEEVYTVKETIALKIGQNIFSGTEICPTDVWERVVKSVTTLDCVF